MREAIDTMTREIAAGVDGRLHSLWLYGSLVLEDFRPGWSDVDFLALAEEPLTQAQAERLLLLRQRLSEQHPENPYYRCFEGVIVSLEEYRNRAFTRLVYWGTSGQRITDRLGRDVFAEYELATSGRAVFGPADRSLFPVPTREELIRAVADHYRGIRSCAAQTDESFYSCGWLLDIARCIYTLRHGAVIGKTRAGERALEEGLFPDDAPLRRTLEIRRNPQEYKNQPEVRAWLRGLGPTVQNYADVLEEALRRTAGPDGGPD